MTWKIRTNEAQLGSTVQLDSTNNWTATIGQLEVESDSKEAIACSMYFGTDPLGFSLAKDSNNLGTEQIQWSLFWGYGGTTFSETLKASSGLICKVGTFFRITAQVVANSGTVAATSKVKIRGMCVPEAPTTEQRKSSVFVTKIGNPFGAVTLPTAAPPPGGAPVPGTAVPCHLLRLWGYNYGANPGYLQLFDSTVVPADTAIPTVPVLYAPVGSSFSASWETTGIPFSEGLTFAFSSTGDTKTVITGGVAINFELLPYPRF